MRILAIAHVIPMRDRSTGWLRFFHLLKVLAEHHELWLHPFDATWQYEHHGDEVVSRYREELQRLGVRITTGGWTELNAILRAEELDLVLVEHYTSARDFLDHIRFRQPQARIVVDSIDVAFSRLAGKAALTNAPADLEMALKGKECELAVYAQADLVIAISDTDRKVLQQAAPTVHVEVVPLIYVTNELPSKCRERKRNLIFVGYFDHEPNVDAIVHFCADVLPLVVERVPDVRLRVVGASPPEAVRALAGQNVEVLGYVPDLEAIYQMSDVAIAPVRYGGGLKGKIAEAIAHGVPVVTNRVGLEGFALRPGKDVLVGETPGQFAEAIVALLGDESLHRTIRVEGWSHIRSEYSEARIRRALEDVLALTQRLPVKRLAPGKRARWAAVDFYKRHVGWRMKSHKFGDSR